MAVGAIASGGICLIDRRRVASLGVSESRVASIIEREAVELPGTTERTEAISHIPEIRNQVVIVIDDDSFAGSTMPAAIMDLWYEDFQETPDRDVTALLENAAARRPESAAV